ncbi:acetyltransferase [Pseudalgibacter alginicilyticus]|uniref:Acetyltransferase n=1 Tax=Pseudalgibacter alginicilyticus TaxID=1736674 RepID=A0A0P0CFE4_9FLAO|nr:GNAT family N-acetyltransferase [Pseudalgibacter alginicilyticus]ALJ04770.1 acetyltransferase [Pseudalgibacter alginicilyticus]
MSFVFKIIDKKEINSVIPLVVKLNRGKISEDVLKERFSEMITQNYECAVIYEGEVLIGVAGLWFCTRHYAGKSMEIDHVYIEEAYRNKGLGQQFFKWLYDYAERKGCKVTELNTYVGNAPSHKFYYNEGFNILGFHFLKKF